MRWSVLPFFLALGIALMSQPTPRAQAQSADDNDPLAGLRDEHPRLMVRSARVWASLKQRRDNDAQLDRLLDAIEAYAEGLIDEPTLERKQVGRRLLGVSREALRRITSLALTYRLTGEVKYLERAEAEMLAVCAFDDWNPSHFLDVAEMALGVSVGDDWLHDALPEQTRDTVRAALAKHALNPAMSQRHWWQRGDNNWNSVCYAGTVASALLLADDHPEAVKTLLNLARQHNPKALAVLAPDGVYPEGPSYWGYGTTFQVILHDLLATGLGDDWGLPGARGFDRTADFLLQVHGPTGAAYNFSDAWPGSRLPEALLWFAGHLDRPHLATPFIRQVRDAERVRVSRISAFAALWWLDAGVGLSDNAGGTAAALPRAWRGRGEQPIVVFREAWDDPDALYLAAKGGRANLSHGHMDAGSFIFEADGVRWAIDLGAQDYESLESRGMKIFRFAQDAQRWSVFRMSNLSHNTLTIDGQHHRVAGQATLESFNDEPGRWSAVFNLSDVFSGQAQTVTRRFVVDPAAGVRIDDALTGLSEGSEVRWAMFTEADVAIADNGRVATLTQDGQTLNVRLLSPDGVRFATASADPPNEYDAPNPGVRRLSTTAAAPASGALEFQVVLYRDESVPQSLDATAGASHDAP